MVHPLIAAGLPMVPLSCLSRLCGAATSTAQPTTVPAAATRATPTATASEL